MNEQIKFYFSNFEYSLSNLGTEYIAAEKILNRL